MTWLGTWSGTWIIWKIIWKIIWPKIEMSWKWPDQKMWACLHNNEHAFTWYKTEIQSMFCFARIMSSAGVCDLEWKTKWPHIAHLSVLHMFHHKQHISFKYLYYILFHTIWLDLVSDLTWSGTWKVPDQVLEKYMRSLLVPTDTTNWGFGGEGVLKITFPWNFDKTYFSDGNHFFF